VPTILFECTQRCNLDCVYCYNIWKAPGGRAVPEMPTLRTIRLLNRVVRQTGCRQVAFTGGEPLLREDLLELAAFLRLRGVRTSVLTNGTLLDRRWVEDLRAVGVGLFQVTLLGMDREVHDRHCGPGSHDAALRAIEAIRSASGRVAVTFILTAWNLAEIEPVCRYVASLGLGGFMFNRFNPGGEGLRHLDDLLPGRETLLAALDTADEAAARHRVQPFLAVPVPPCVAAPERFPHLRLAWCIAGSRLTYFTVDPQGNVRLCNHSPTVLGNLFDTAFADLANADAVRRFRNSRPDLCADCPHWERCLGSCRAASEQLLGTCRGLDPFLQRMGIG
jgi:radical SAM protein with 4Fe4S-binding SPASM domain